MEGEITKAHCGLTGCPAPRFPDSPRDPHSPGQGEGTGTGKISHLPKATRWELKVWALDLVSDWRPCSRHVPLRVRTRSALDTHHPTNPQTNSAQRALILQKGKLRPPGDCPQRVAARFRHQVDPDWAPPPPAAGGAPAEAPAPRPRQRTREMVWAG